MLINIKPIENEKKREKKREKRKKKYLFTQMLLININSRRHLFFIDFAHVRN